MTELDKKSSLFDKMGEGHKEGMLLKALVMGVEVRIAGSNVAIAEFGMEKERDLAVETQYKDLATGEEKTSWIRVMSYNSLDTLLMLAEKMTEEEWIAMTASMTMTEEARRR